MEVTKTPEVEPPLLEPIRCGGPPEPVMVPPSGYGPKANDLAPLPR